MESITTTFRNWRPLMLLAGSIIAATWFLSAKMNDYSTRLNMVEAEGYTLTVASELALRFAIENPGMRVPDPRDPSKIITVAMPGMRP